MPAAAARIRRDPWRRPSAKTGGEFGHPETISLNGRQERSSCRPFMFIYAPFRSISLFILRSPDHSATGSSKPSRLRK